LLGNRKSRKKVEKVLDIPEQICYNKGTKGEGKATREERADPRESVRPSPMTLTAGGGGIKMSLI
jgi:hypothetical protein